jgi:hypothetical protein
VFWLAVQILLGFLLITAITLLAAKKVVILAATAYPSAIREVKLAIFAFTGSCFLSNDLDLIYLGSCSFLILTLAFLVESNLRQICLKIRDYRQFIDWTIKFGGLMLNLRLVTFSLKWAARLKTTRNMIKPIKGDAYSESISGISDCSVFLVGVDLPSSPVSSLSTYKLI